MPGRGNTTTLMTTLVAILLSIVPEPHNPPSPPPSWLILLVESRTGLELPQVTGPAEFVFPVMTEAFAFSHRAELLNSIADECSRMSEIGWRISAVWAERRGQLIRLRIQFSPSKP